ncbi:protein FAM151B [Thrips palmi]|uniref:Protein FAM151B n=1 Tax=Thrips palmi TaxID=161013 RepID=A0A6P8Z5T8_THRPL|nr:protein FAM151B [Thrips palmi]
MAWTSALRPQLPALLVAVLCAFLAPVSAQPADAMASTPVPAVPAVPIGVAGAVKAVPDSQNISAFFPKINGDLTKISWAHAVNNQSLLAEALNGSVMMMEADVIMSAAGQPVMGHPPADSSDLSLLEFLRSVTAFNTDHQDAPKGIKLDFKSIEVFEKALEFLKQNFKDVPAFPVWLNADILPGPVNASESGTIPVDAKRFLDKAKAEYPDLMLSLGWTTRWGSKLDQSQVPVDQVKYSPDQVKAMIAAIKNSAVDQPITYAVRAAFVANSLDELKSLLDQTPQASGQATLSVWSSDDTDVVDVKQLKKNILALGKDRVYVDVGEQLAKDLNLSSASATTYASVATTLMALMAVMLRAL